MLESDLGKGTERLLLDRDAACEKRTGLMVAPREREPSAAECVSELFMAEATDWIHRLVTD
jgi:hypothetical protein